MTRTVKVKLESNLLLSLTFNGYGYISLALVPFCPTGKATNPLPEINNFDIIDIFALKKPVWQSKVGNLLGLFVRV